MNSLISSQKITLENNGNISNIYRSYTPSKQKAPPLFQYEKFLFWLQYSRGQSKQEGERQAEWSMKKNPVADTKRHTRPTDWLPTDWLPTDRLPTDSPTLTAD